MKWSITKALFKFCTTSHLFKNQEMENLALVEKCITAVLHNDTRAKMCEFCTIISKCLEVIKTTINSRHVFLTNTKDFVYKSTPA